MNPFGRSEWNKRMADQPDYYEILQVHPAAEPEVVQAAYRRLSQKYHPDVYHGQDAQRRMTQLNQAYAVLSDTQKRAAYDRQRFGTSSTREQATPSKAGPTLQVSPLVLDLGIMPLGRARTATLRVHNGGLGQLSGMVLSHVAWLHISPSDFAGNDQDVVVRFQPTTMGEFKSPRALEIYSNGGKIAISVRGRVEESTAPESQPPAAGAERRSSVYPTSQKTNKSIAPLSNIKVPFMGWVAMLTMVTSTICFLISPYLVIVPAGLGLWMTWEHYFARKRAEQGQTRRAAPKAQRTGARGAVKLARCLRCGAAMDPLNVGKCVRCGGSICSSCGACACRGSGARFTSRR